MTAQPKAGLRALIAPIAAQVAAHCDITVADLRGPNRSRRYARPRQIVYLLAKEQAGRSLPEIGRYFGRDHTTVLDGIRTVKALAERDARLRADLAALRVGGAHA